MKTVNVGLVGFGLAGRVFHEPILASVPGFKICKIYEGSDENIKIIKSKYNEDVITHDINQIVKNENIELVVLAVPNSVHYNLAKKALENCKNVVIEKPFTVTSKEADVLINLAKDKNKILTIHHNRRWDSDFLTIQKIAKENLLGNLVEYEAHFDRFRNFIKENTWKEDILPGSGILYDLGSHLIDQAQCLFGNPDEVFADLGIQRNGGRIIDNFELILNYQNIKVTLKAGMIVRELGPHFKLLGTKGSFTKYGMDVQEAFLKAGKTPKDVIDWGKEPEELWGSIDTELNGIHVIGKVESELGDYREFYRNVYKALNREEEINVTAQQARDTIKIIELAQISNIEKRWVTFSN